MSQLLSEGQQVSASDVSTHYTDALSILQQISAVDKAGSVLRQAGAVEVLQAFASGAREPSLRASAVSLVHTLLHQEPSAASTQGMTQSQLAVSRIAERVQARETKATEHQAQSPVAPSADGAPGSAASVSGGMPSAVAAAAQQLVSALDGAATTLTQRTQAIRQISSASSVSVPAFEAGSEAAATVLSALLPGGSASANTQATQERTLRSTNAHMAAISTAEDGRCFPFVALTRADERRLVDLLLLFKRTAAGEAQGQGQGQAQGDAPALEQQLASVFVGCNPAARPFLAFSQLYLRDFPAEVFLACPQLLAHLTAPLLSAPQGSDGTGSAAEQSYNAVVTAAANALVDLLTGVHASLQALVTGADTAAAATSGGSRNTAAAATDDEVAAAAAATLARHESRAAVRDYVLGHGVSAPAQDHHYGSAGLAGSHGTGIGATSFHARLPNGQRSASSSLYSTSGSGEDAAALPVDSRYSPLSAVAARSGWRFLPHVTSGLQTQVSHYYSQRYRYPPTPRPQTVIIHPGLPAVDAATAVVSGVAAWQRDNASLLDAPIAVSRFAAVVAEAAFAACASADRVELMLPVLALALPLATDPALQRGNISSLHPEDTIPSLSPDGSAALQRCLDTASASVLSLLTQVRSTAVDRDAAEAAIATAAAFQRQPPQTPLDAQHAIVSYATLFSLLPARFFPFFELVVSHLLLRIPSHALSQDPLPLAPASPGADAADNLHSRAVAELSSLTDSERTKIRRAAYARSSGRVQVSSTLLTALSGAVCARRITSAFPQWEDGLTPIFERFLGPLEASRKVARRITADVAKIPRALKAAASAASAASAAAPSAAEEAADSSRASHAASSVAAPAAAAWKAFTSAFHSLDRKAPASTVQRISSALLYGSASSTTVDRLCALAVSATAASGAGPDTDDESDPTSTNAHAASTVLCGLLLHPLASVRVAAYKALRQGSESCSAVQLSQLVVPSGVLRVCIHCGLLDDDSSVAAASALALTAICTAAATVAPASGAKQQIVSLIARCCGGNGAGVVLAKALADNAANTPAADAFANLSTLMTALLSAPATQSSQAEALQKVQALFATDVHARASAAAALGEAVNSSLRDATIDLAKQRGHGEAYMAAVLDKAAAVVSGSWYCVGSDLREDPVSTLVAAYPRGDRLPLHPVSAITPLAQSLPTVSTPVDPAEAAAVIVAAARDSSRTRYESAVAFGGSQLAQLEASMTATQLPLPLRTSAAEQIAHALIFTAPVPLDIQRRLVTTIRITLAAARLLLLESGADLMGLPSQAEWEIAKQRAVAAFAVLVDAATAVSAPVREFLRGDQDSILLCCEIMWQGPAVAVYTASPEIRSYASANRPPTVGHLPASARSVGAAPQMIDARLAAVRTLARIAFEAEAQPKSPIERVAVRTAIPDGAKGPAAEVLVDGVLFNNLPLLRSIAVAAGPTTLVPCVSLHPAVILPTTAVGDAHASSNSSPITAFLLQQTRVSGESTDRHLALALEATEMLADAAQASNHVAFGAALQVLIAACKADVNFARAAAQVQVAVDGSNDGDAEAPTMSRTLNQFARFLEVSPTAEADCWVLQTLLEMLQLLGPHFLPSDRLALTSVLQDRLLPLLALTETERRSGDSIIATHLQHATPSADSEEDAAVQHSPVARAELLIDALRPSEYNMICDKFSTRVHAPTAADGEGNSRLRAAITSSSALDDRTVWDVSPFTPGRTALVRAVLNLSAAVCGPSSVAGSADQTEQTQMQMVAAVAADEEVVQNLLALLLHPHVDSTTQASVLRVFDAMLCNHEHVRSGVTYSRASLDALLGIEPSSLPELQPTPNPAACLLTHITRALVRTATLHGSLDSFQHKSLVGLAVTSLLRIASYGVSLRERSLQHSQLVLDPAIWTERPGGTFAWLQRLAVDREAQIRASAFRLFACLVSNPVCYQRMETDPSLSDVLSSALRHATTTVVALFAPEEASSGTHGVLHVTSHTDLEDAEAPSVRAACAELVTAFVRTGASADATRMRFAQPHTEQRGGPVFISDRLFAMDTIGRFRLALRGLASSAFTPVYAGPLLAALAACAEACGADGEGTVRGLNTSLSSRGDSGYGLLHAVLSDPAAREGLIIAACGHTVSNADNAGEFSATRACCVRNERESRPS